MYFGIWLTPVFFTKDILPEKVNFVWFLNPMASVVEGWRWCLFPDWPLDVYCLPGLVVSFLLFLLGFALYKKTETRFSDFV
jgi:ABC-type polysaccharide/polyol phosphate export permease